MSNQEDMLKMLSQFDAISSQWPEFEEKFHLYCRAKKIAYVIDRISDDIVIAGETSVARALREAQSKTREEDDAKAQYALISKLSKDAYSMIRGLNTCYEMIRVLRGHFHSESTSSVIANLDKLFDLSFGTSSSMTIQGHIAAINSRIYALKQSGTLDWDKIHQVVLLRSMPKDSGGWSSIVNSLKTMDPENLTKDKIIRAFIDYDQDNSRDRKAGKFNRDVSGNSAFIGQQLNQNNQRRSTPVQSKGVTCFKCGKLGHVQKNCYVKPENYQIKDKHQGNVIQGQSSQSSKTIKKEDQLNSNSSFSFSTFGDYGGHKEDPEQWFEDSGASQIYTFRRDAFHTFKETKEVVKIGDSSKLEVKGFGLIKFMSKTSDGEINEVSFKKAYYVPDICANLFSTAVLSKLGFQIVMQDGMTRYNFKGKEVMCSKLMGHRWYLNLRIVLPDHVANVVKSNDADLWHKRLCHLGKDNLLKLKGMTDLKFDDEFKDVCEDCIVSKLKRRPFKLSSNPRARYPLDLIHMDLVVINVPGRNSEMYALIMTDDHSSCRFAFCMESRSGSRILQDFIPWLVWAERVSNRKLKTIRCDNAKEFTSGIFRQKLKDLGIELQTSVPYEHEQNGTAEVSNRIVMEKARTILIASGLEKKYWPDSVLTAVFCCNRSPVADLKLTPIELFTDVSPNMMGKVPY